jgi:hypothetical protein
MQGSSLASRICELITVKKNRCILKSASGARDTPFSGRFLNAGGDNFRDNLGKRSVPVTESLSYT